MDELFELGIDEIIDDRQYRKSTLTDGLTSADGTPIAFMDRLALLTHHMSELVAGAGSAYSDGRRMYRAFLSVKYGDKAVAELDDDAIDRMLVDEHARIKVRFPASDIPRFTFIDLFAGIGGFRLAMQHFGGKCVYSSEFNEAAQLTYLHNYGEVPFGDITSEQTKMFIPEHFDVLCGGFPCQAFSVAGYRRGFDDARGTLFFDVAEIIRRHRPRAVFLENVKNLQTHDNGRTFAVIKGTLEELGYRVFSKVLNAMEYADVPQNRERIIIVAFDPEQVPNYGNFEFPEPVQLKRTIHDMIDTDVEDERYFYRENHIYYPKLREAMLSRDTIYQWRRIYVRENKSGVCPTLTANMGGGGHNVPLILTDAGIRKLTPKECANFMGFPESFEFSPRLAESRKYMQAGNSVVVPLMVRVAESITDILLGNE